MPCLMPFLMISDGCCSKAALLERFGAVRQHERGVLPDALEVAGEFQPAHALGVEQLVALVDADGRFRAALSARSTFPA